MHIPKPEILRCDIYITEDDSEILKSKVMKLKSMLMLT
jgi:hypothetical protein